MKKVERWVCLDNLPIYKSGEFKGSIDWFHVPIGTKIEFKYGDVLDYIEISGKYNPKSRTIVIKYNNKSFNINVNQLKQCGLGRIIGKFRNGFRYVEGSTIISGDCNITILSALLEEKSGRIRHKYKYKCNICGNIDWCHESTVQYGKYICNVCSGNKVLIGVNDIPTTEPWMIQFFQGGVKEAEKYSKYSTFKISPICPDCGKVRKDKIAINRIYYEKGISCNCNDGISYPNKFMYKLLSIINVEFINEYQPIWLKPYYFDFYLPSLNIVIEMDGGLGHGHKQYNNFGLGSLESKRRDNLKDSLAKSHHIDVIRVDAIKSEYEYLVNSIKYALGGVLDLNDVDWKECEKYALSNAVKEVCNLYELRKPISTYELGLMVGKSGNTVARYLKRGSKIGWCNYDLSDVEKNRQEKISRNNKKRCSKPVYVFDKDGKFIKEYSSCHEVQDLSIVDFGFRLSYQNVSAVCCNKRKSYKGLLFSYNKNL